MMTTLAEAQRDLANFGNVLARVRGEIISGNHVDLSGLPERTEALCRDRNATLLISGVRHFRH